MTSVQILQRMAALQRYSRIQMITAPCWKMQAALVPKADKKELQDHRSTGNNYSTPSPLLIPLVTTEEEEKNIVVGYQKLREQHQDWQG